MSYGQVARMAGNPRGARAVGFVLHRNPEPGVIPCHRVVGADGSLGGYSAGLDRKRFLLDLEGIPYNEGACCNIRFATGPGNK